MNNSSKKQKYTEQEKKEYIAKMREIREQCFAIFFEMSFTDDSYQDILDNAVESRMIVADEYMVKILEYYSNNTLIFLSIYFLLILTLWIKL